MANKPTPHSGHRSRMMARFESDQLLIGFSEHEILEMLLYYCIPRANTNELAHKLIGRFRSLDGVMSSSVEELEASGLVTRRTALSLKYFYAVSGILQCGSRKGISISDMLDVKDLVYSYFKDQRRECCRMFGINEANTLEEPLTLSYGDEAAVEVEVRELLSAAFKLNCKRILIAHNHPFTNASPSNTDIAVTEQFRQRLSDNGYELFDHIIIGQLDMFSFRENGLLINSMF